MNDGTLTTVGGRPAVQFERIYADRPGTPPIERVWRAVTDPGELATWFPSVVLFEPRIGGAVSFTDDPNIADQTGIVKEYDPPLAFGFTWGDNEIQLRLEREGDQCRRFVLINVLAARNEAARNAAGWDVCLAEFDKLIAGGEPGGPHSDTAADWKKSYDAYVGSGMPSGAPIPG